MGVRRRRPGGLGLALLAAAALLVALLIGAVALLAYAEARSHQGVQLPAPSGSDVVGRAIFDWTDPTRLDPYAPKPDTPRELSVWVWYPAGSSSTSPRAPYYPAEWINAFGDGAPFHTSLAVIRSNAMANAPIADGVHPTLVFAPGLGLSAADYTSLLEDLASFGYVVAGIDPTYSTDVVLSGDRVVPSINKARDNADYSQLVSLWAADIRFVATMLTTLSRDSGSPFGGHVDVQRIGFFGHSAGGAAATEACRMDESCVAAVDMDGDLAGDVAQLGLGKPFLFIGHDGATSSSALRSELRGVMRDAPQENGIIIEIRHTQHEDFTDRAAYFNFLGSQLGFLGSIDGFRALEITRRYLRAAFGAWLLQRPDDVLIYSSAAYPEVSHITL